MLSTLKNIKENFDNIKNNSSSIDINGNIYQNSSNLQPIVKKQTKTESTPESTSFTQSKPNNILWVAIGFGGLIVLFFIFLLIKFLFFSSSAEQPTSIPATYSSPIEPIPSKPLESNNSIFPFYKNNETPEQSLNIKEQSIYKPESLPSYKSFTTDIKQSPAPIQTPIQTPTQTPTQSFNDKTFSLPSIQSSKQTSKSISAEKSISAKKPVSPEKPFISPEKPVSPEKEKASIWDLFSPKKEPTDGTKGTEGIYGEKKEVNGGKKYSQKRKYVRKYVRKNPVKKNNPIRKSNKK